MEKKINLSHNLMGCRLDNWIRLKRSNPITEENKGQVRLITAVSSILAIPAFLEWLDVYKRQVFFLRSSPDTTITMPGMSRVAITAGAYQAVGGSI